MRISIFILVFLLYCGVSSGYTQESQSEPSSTKKTTTEKIDDYHQRTGQMLFGSAEWIDSFFGTEIYAAEVNKSYMRFQLGGFQEEGEDLDVNARFKLSLKLPKAEKKLRLTIASDPDQIDRTDDMQDDAIREPVEDVEDSTTAALEYFRLDRNNHNLKFSGGALFRDSSPVIFASTRYRYLITYDPWTIRFVERLRWYTDQGWDSRTEIDFERQVDDRLFFRTTPSLKWKEEKDGFDYGWYTSLYHAIDQKTALEYQFNTFFNTEISGRVKEINLRLRYRRQVWREWLILEVAPQLAWYESRNFETVPGILVQLEIWIGRYKRSINA